MTIDELFASKGITYPTKFYRKDVIDTLNSLWIDCWDVITYLDVMQRTLWYEWQDNSYRWIMDDRITHYIETWE